MRIIRSDREIRCFVGALALICVVALGGCAPLSLGHARLKGYSAYQEGNWQRARDYFTDCVEGDATDWKARYYLGRVLLDGYNEPIEARRHLEVADEIRRSRPDVMLAPRPTPTEAAVPYPTLNQIVEALAEAMLRAGDDDRLVTYLRQTANEYGEDIDHYLRLGRYLERLDDHDGARVAYQTAARLSGAGDASAYVVLSDFYDGIGDRDAALTALRRGYGVNPGQPGLVDRIRAHGAVPGPTLALPALE